MGYRMAPVLNWRGNQIMTILYADGKAVRGMNLESSRSGWRGFSDSVEVQGSPLDAIPGVLAALPRAEGRVLVILSRRFYTLRPEYYPVALGRGVKKVLAFDWDGNLAAPDRTIGFHAEPVRTAESFSVPIFSMDKDLFQAIIDLTNRNVFIVPDCLVEEAWGRSVSIETFASGLHGFCGPDGGLDWAKWESRRVVEAYSIVEGGTPLSLLWQWGVTSASKPSSRTLHLLEKDLWDVVSGDKCGTGDQSVVLSDAPFQSRFDLLLEGIRRAPNLSTFNGNLRLGRISIPVAAYVCVLFVILYGMFAVNTLDRQAVVVSELSEQRLILEKAKQQWLPLSRQVKAREQVDQTGDVSARVLSFVLERLTASTPRHSWVSSFRYDDGRIFISVHSPSAMRFKEILERIPEFRDVRLTTSVQRDRRSGDERCGFSLRFDTASGKTALAGSNEGGV